MAEAPLEHVVQVGDLAALSISGFDEANEAKIALLFGMVRKMRRPKLAALFRCRLRRLFQPQKKEIEKLHIVACGTQRERISFVHRLCNTDSREPLTSLHGTSQDGTSQEEPSESAGAARGGKKGPGLC